MTESPDRSFADDHPVDSIDTEKSRIVLHEIEKGWWILAVRPNRYTTLKHKLMYTVNRSHATADAHPIVYSVKECIRQDRLEASYRVLISRS